MHSFNSPTSFTGPKTASRNEFSARKNKRSQYVSLNSRKGSGELGRSIENQNLRNAHQITKTAQIYLSKAPTAR